MISFDPTSVYNRAVSRLQQDPDWKPIINESVISALIKSNSEIIAETARYAEYLFKESKWNTAQNESSILAMANMLGYQPKRRVSAVGKIYVSTDPNIHLVGKTYSASTFEDSPTNCSYLSTYNENVRISTVDIIKDTTGKKYIPVNESTLSYNETSTPIEIVQGERKSININIDTIRSVCTRSKINSYLYIPFRISNCENATSIFSRKFLKLFVVDKNSTEQEYRIVDSLLLSDTLDKDVELYNDMYDSTLFYAKFNNSQYRGRTLDVSSNSSIDHIRVEYIESSGAEGNISSLYENFILETSGGVRLYGINTSYISGGADNEDINSVKENATKFYIDNYSIGTKESYEKAVLNTEFTVEGINIKPKKVIVYGGQYTDSETNLTIPATYISFTSDGLDDIATSTDRDDLYLRIENILNYYLGRLKSPQDTIKFAIPNYIPISVGVNCLLDSEDTSEDSVTNTKMQTFINELWGPSSDSISFGNNFTASGLEREIMSNFDNITSIDIEVEAIHQLDWQSAEFVNSVSSKTSQNTMLRTIRVPFSFSSVFLGNKTRKGFKDLRTGASYVLRMDLLYKRPTALASGVSLNKSIFVGNYTKDGKLNTSSEDSVAFYAMKDTGDIWGTDSGTGGTTYFNGTYYDILNSATPLVSDVHQVKYESKIFTDSDYDTLRQRIKEGTVATQSFTTSLGALDSFLIYFSGNCQENSIYIGDGWVEFSLDSLYTILQYFATDTSSNEILNKLNACPLSVLKCGTLESTSEVFSIFKELLTSYIDVYISMRPIDNNLRLITSSLTDKIKSNNQKSIIYIDSSDSDTQQNVENLTPSKYARMIYVNCEHEES